AFAALISAVIIAVGEYFFHIYLMRKDLGGSRFLEPRSE
ncbi:DUF2512 family protein, partial [Bacillus amyloliquefaciens]